MTMQATVIQLESWAQQELQAQRELLFLLEAQQAAIDTNSADGIIEAGEAIQAHLRRGPARENQRLELLRRFAKHAGVAPRTLTLRSIAERAAAEDISTEKLQTLRAELREVGAQVLRRGRRIAVLARYHQGLLAEMLTLLAQAATGDAPQPTHSHEEGGALLNQQA